MAWGPAPTSALTVPSDAGPNDPAWTVGEDIPPELVSYYASKAPAPGMIVIAVQIFRSSATNYAYIALVTYQRRTALRQGVVTWISGNPGHLGVDELTAMTRNISSGFDIPEFIMGSGGVGVIRISTGAEFLIESGAKFTIDSVSAPRGEIGASYSTAGTLVTCTGPEIAMPSYGAGGLDTNFTFKAGRLYQVDVTYSLTYSAGGTTSIVTLRKGLNTVVGQKLGSVLADFNGVNFGYGIAAYATFYVKNATAADIWPVNFGLTVQRPAGAGNIGLYGDAQRPIIVRVCDITDTAPSLAGIAVPLA